MHKDSSFATRRVSEAAPREPFTCSLVLDDVPLRVREIAMLRGLGYSYRQIAEPLKVTPQAVSLMLTRHRRSRRALHEALELGSLSSRAVNALGRHGIGTRQQAREASALKLLAHERNCGRKTLEEIARWMEQDAADALAAGSSASRQVA
jgi:hypothetical protein